MLKLMLDKSGNGPAVILHAFEIHAQPCFTQTILENSYIPLNAFISIADPIIRFGFTTERTTLNPKQGSE